MGCAVGVPKGIFPLPLPEFRRRRADSIRPCAVALVPPNPVKTPDTERDSQPGSTPANNPGIEPQIRWHRQLRPSTQTDRSPAHSPFSQPPGCPRRDLQKSSPISARRSFRAREGSLLTLAAMRAFPFRRDSPLRSQASRERTRSVSCARLRPDCYQDNEVGHSRSVRIRPQPWSKVNTWATLYKLEPRSARKLRRFPRVLTKEWTGWDLNPRPLPCQDSDLPADLPARDALY